MKCFDAEDKQAHPSQHFQAVLASEQQSATDEVIIFFGECSGTQTVCIQSE